MSKIDYQKLREIAEKTKIAGEAPVMPFDQRINALNDFMKHFSPDIALALLDERERNQQYIKSRDKENEDIALTVGKLRVELEAEEKTSAAILEALDRTHKMFQREQCRAEAAEKRIAELEKSEEQLINERDHAESALADMYFAATGDRPEWSNWFGFSDAVDAVVDRIADLEAKQPSPVVPEEKPMPNALSMLEREITQLIGDAQEATVTGYELIAEAWRLMDGQDPKTSDWHSKASKYLNSNIVEKVDDDRIEVVKAVLRRLAGNSPVTPDGWVMVPKELTPEMMRAVQIRSELGGYATSNLSGAYNMFSEFWNVAVSAAPKVDDL
ncbi:ead/Ea22-like family protein [Escherichia coli]